MITVMAVLALGAGIAYLQPPGHRAVEFDISDAAAIKPGVEVRVAGLHAGQVEGVHVDRNSVHVTVSIDDSIYIGNQSSIDVRMLTAAGGYYVNLVSAGPTQLAGATIPTARTHPPYQLPSLLADSANKLRQVDPSPLVASLDQLATGLENNPTAITTITASMHTITQVVSSQQQQVRTALDAAREIMHTAVLNRDVLTSLLNKTAVLVATLDNFKIGFSQAITGLAKMFDRLSVALDFYDSHREWALDLLQRINNSLNLINTDVPRIIWNLGNFTTTVRNLILPPGATPAPVPEKPLVATDMCVPIPGRTC
ncbi:MULTISPECIES: MlaD family protein [unclassified Mycobacterium]|uniref:MlaD family protein n=1 Tax=unclassified Mycobacterium TaxID=2642494 RepID=UPI00089B691B|nr:MULTISPECIES: MlaD family protein [unclassified Mycobacterium]SEA31307.1 MlaD protein [Mycobacterium sp. 283mftsu]